MGIRKLLRYLKYIISSVLLLALLIYLVMVVINWDDQPQSELSIKIEKELESRINISDKDNAYITILGFSSPPDVDPFSLGIERRAWEEKALKINNFEHSDYPLEDDTSFESGISSSVGNLIKVCGQVDKKCLNAIEKGMIDGNDWFRNEKWLLDRYSELIMLPGYQGPLEFDLNALPPYGEVLKAQRLYLANAWILVGNNEISQVQNMLEQDLRFWRMVLVNSDILITKMISIAAIRNHFMFGNIVFRQVHDLEDSNNIIPESWRVSFSREERSLRRCLIGEWKFMDRMMRLISAGDHQLLYGLDEPTLWDKTFSKIGLQFWKKQDTSNKHLKTMMDLAALFDANYEEIPDRVSEFDLSIEAQSKSFFSFYNPVGNILTKVALPAFDDYGVRVADIEGVRRAALMAIEVRAKADNFDDINKILKSSEFREPYWHRQFEWDKESNSILFYGLEPGERGKHEILL